MITWMITKSERYLGFVKQPGFWLFLLVAIVASGFVLTTPHTVLMNDSQKYFLSAQVLLGLDDRSLVTREGEMWTHLLRAPWYILHLTVVIKLFSAWGEDTVLSAVRVSQALLLGANAWLVYRIGGQLGFSKPLAWLTGLLMLLYLPFLFQTDRLLTETQTTTFFLTFAWLWLMQRPKLAGVFLFLALSNSWLSLWPKVFILLVLLLLVWLVFKPDRQAFLKKLGWCAVPFVVGAALMQGVYQIMPHGYFQPVYFWQYFDTDGWAPMLEINGALTLLAAKAQVFSGGLWPWIASLPEGLNEGLRMLWLHPETVVMRYLVNIARFFALPDNLYQQTGLGISPDVLWGMHQTILLGAWLAMARVFQDKRCGVLVLFPVLWALAYSFSNIELRYNLPVMPFVILLAVLGWQSVVQVRSTSAWLGAVGLLLISLLGFSGLMYPDVAGFLLPVGYFVLLVVLFVGLSFWLFSNPLVFIAPMSRILTSGVVAVVLLATFVMSPQALSWRQAISSTEPIRQQIIVDSAFFDVSDWNPAEPMTTFLVLDILPVVDPPGQRMDITINGLPVLDKRPYTRDAVPFGLSLQKHLLGGLRDSQDIRQYRFLRLTPAIEADILRRGHANVSIQAMHAAARNPLWLYGDYPADNVGGAFIPNPDWGCFSIYKALFNGEGRQWIGVQKSGIPSTKGVYRIMLVRMQQTAANQLDYAFPVYQYYPDGHLGKEFRLAY